MLKRKELLYLTDNDEVKGAFPMVLATKYYVSQCFVAVKPFLFALRGYKTHKIKCFKKFLPQTDNYFGKP